MGVNLIGISNTLSASYLGFDSSYIIYNGNLEGEWVINLKTLFKLDEVEVRAKGVDMVKILKKYMTIPKFSFMDKKYFLAFESSFIHEGKTRNSEGSVEMVFSPSFPRQYKFKCIALDAVDDTTRIVSQIGQSLGYALSVTNSLSFDNTYKNAHITSREIQDGQKIFILAYREGFNTTQFILYVDVESKTLKHAEFSHLHFPPATLLINISYVPGTGNEIKITDFEYELYSLQQETLRVTGKDIKESRYKGAARLFIE